MSKTTIYAAKKIITMNPRQPVTSHIAVRDGHILGTGTLEELAGWGEYELDDRFADKILMPGLVEGHSHSWEGAAWEDVFVGFHGRRDPEGRMHSGLDSIDAVDLVVRLQEITKKRILPDKFKGVRTVKDVVDAVDLGVVFAVGGGGFDDFYGADEVDEV